ncbi:MAG TPA: LamG-like jellyroll fold domain-containing protein, partial [Anaerolineales bacterium]|nr:LamG-like jellyroll fold domain-containing protein [Anaerolineales bacterium]
MRRVLIVAVLAWLGAMEALPPAGGRLPADGLAAAIDAPPAIQGSGASFAEGAHPEVAPLLTLAGALTWLESSASLVYSSLAGFLPSRTLQVDMPVPLVSDGEFVWGPNVGDFDVTAFLRSRRSPLAPYASEVALWASYSSVNPKLLLATLEYRYGLVSRIPSGTADREVRAMIEDTAVSMATAFYDHLYARGQRKPALRPLPGGAPVILLEDGTTALLERDVTSGSYGLATVLGRSLNSREFVAAVTPSDPVSFERVFGSMFPDGDLQATTNTITPADLPVPTLLQFPFPLGATWTFGGPHSWNGNSTPPFSSMDFFTGGSTCAAPAYLYSVSAAAGTASRIGSYDCWLEINHGAGWTTSYYHLQNLGLSGTVGRNAALGTIGCEICAGGYATGPHVHFSLKYNGAYIGLEGVQLSGWTVHEGTVAYTSGSIERGAVILNPYTQVLNDYHLYYGTGANASFEYFGNDSPTVDRVRFPVDNPLNPDQEPPVDGLGSDDITIDFWIRAMPGDNAAGAINCGANANWTQGNIVFDRRRSGQGREFGISLANGRLVFGVTGATGTSLTLCGTTDVADGQWHHISVQHNRWDGVSPDGFMWLFVDGRLEASGAGPGGDIDYPNNVTPVTPVDPYLYLGGDKYGAGSSFKGWIDELRVSNVLRTRVDFLPPTAPYITDGNTGALFHFDEAGGEVLYDTSGFGAGPSSGERLLGGVPMGPAWSAANPFETDPGTSTPMPSDTPSPTGTLPTATVSPTATSSPTAIPTATPTLTPTPPPPSTATPTSSTPIIVDHTSVALFESIPEPYLQAAS